jgi:hypothetical protein
MRIFVVCDYTSGVNYLVKASSEEEAVLKLKSIINMQEAYADYVRRVEWLNNQIKDINEMCHRDGREDVPLCELGTYDEYVEEYEIGVEGEFTMESDIVDISDTIIAEYI